MSVGSGVLVAVGVAKPESPTVHSDIVRISTRKQVTGGNALVKGQFRGVRATKIGIIEQAWGLAS